MRKTMVTERAWIVRDKKAYGWISSLAGTRSESIKKFVDEASPWVAWYRQGFRCVKVSISEI